MEEMVAQNDGTYAVCFRNVKKLSTEEVENIFRMYGDVYSIRQSSEAVPWVFIRYENKEEALSALNGLRDYKDFDIQVAKSNPKKKQEQFGDREKSECLSEDTRDNRSIKGGQSRNRGLEKSVMGSENNDGVDTKKSPYTRKYNNFAERPFRNKEGDGFNHNGRMSESEGAGALSPSREMDFSKNQRTSSGQYFRGREQRGAVRESAENDRKGIDGSRDGPPKLMKGSEFYANSLSVDDSCTRGLALLAARDEVWENHPLHAERTLKEIIITNFDDIPSKKAIYELCLPVKPLHVSFGWTPTKSVFCRILVSSEKEADQLLKLSSPDGVYVTTLGELLDDVFLCAD